MNISALTFSWTFNLASVFFYYYFDTLHFSLQTDNNPTAMSVLFWVTLSIAVSTGRCRRGDTTDSKFVLTAGERQSPDRMAKSVWQQPRRTDRTATSGGCSCVKTDRPLARTDGQRAKRSETARAFGGRERPSGGFWNQTQTTLC